MQRHRNSTAIPQAALVEQSGSKEFQISIFKVILGAYMTDENDIHIQKMPARIKLFLFIIFMNGLINFIITRNYAIKLHKILDDYIIDEITFKSLQNKIFFGAYLSLLLNFLIIFIMLKIRNESTKIFSVVLMWLAGPGIYLTLVNGQMGKTEINMIIFCIFWSFVLLRSKSVDEYYSNS